MEPQANTTLTIPGVHCQHCAQTVTSTLTNLSEVVSVQVDLATKTAQVTSATETLPFAHIERALASAGYPGVSYPGVRCEKALPLAFDQKRDTRRGEPHPLPKGLEDEQPGEIDHSQERTID